MATIKMHPNLPKLSLRGRRFEYTYRGSGMRGEVTFDEDKANWQILAGTNSGMSGSDPYRALSISRHQFFVMWHEPANGMTVVLTIDSQAEAVFAVVVSPDEVEVDMAYFTPILA